MRSLWGRLRTKFNRAAIGGLLMVELALGASQALGAEMPDTSTSMPPGGSGENISVAALDMPPLQIDSTVKSYNYDRGRGGAPIKYIVLHCTVSPTFSSAFHTLVGTPRGNGVSAHYLVSKEGDPCLLVSESDIAKHAGRSAWKNDINLNDCSIGIEIENDGKSPYPEAQINAVIRLCRDISRRYNIPPENIIAHSDIAMSLKGPPRLGRKNDPGPLFPWKLLAENGIGFWPQPIAHGLGPEDAKVLLQICGYNTEDVGSAIACFRMHYEPEDCIGKQCDDPSLAVLGPQTLDRIVSIAAQTLRVRGPGPDMKALLLAGAQAPSQTFPNENPSLISAPNSPSLGTARGPDDRGVSLETLRKVRAP